MSPADVLTEHGFLPGLDEPRRQDFIKACKEGPLEVVRAYLDLGMPLDTTREITNEPALVAAAEGGSIEITQLLLERGGNLEQLDSSGDTALRTALNWSHPELVRFLAGRGASLDAPNPHGESALEHAITEDKDGDVALLLELGANPAFVAKNTSPMRAAIRGGKLAIVQQLLDAGASPNLVLDEHRVTPLHDAIRQDQAEIVDLLLERGADPTARDAYHLTPLDYALERGQRALGDGTRQQQQRADVWQALENDDVEAALATLGDADLPVDIRNRDHATPLATLASKGHVEGVRALLARGASTAPAGIAPIIGNAISEGHTEVVELLLAADAPLVTADDEIAGAGGAVWEGHVDTLAVVLAACTPAQRQRFARHVYSAVMQSNVEVVRLLIDAGVPVDEPEGIGGDRPLTAALTSWFSAEIAELLLDAGASVRSTDDHRNTPLHELLSHYGWTDDREPVLRLLLERGAPLDALNWQHLTPLAAASDEARPVLVRVVGESLGAPWLARSWALLPILYELERRDEILRLIDAGTPVNPSVVGPTGVLDVAVSKNDVDFVRELLARGADANRRTSYGYTPFLSAVAEGNTVMLHLLAGAGVDVHAMTDSGHTAVHMAKNVATLELLAELGARFDQRAHSPVIGVAREGDEAQLDFLIARGAYLDGTDPWGRTALVEAIREGHPGVALKLIAAGASPTRASRDPAELPITMAAKQGQVDVVRLLINAGASVTEPNAAGETALQLMTRRKQLREAFADLLAAQGIDVTVPRVERLPVELTTITPGWAAVYRNDVEAVRAALEAGELDAKTADPWGVTALMLATQFRNTELVELLLEHGADFRAQDPQGARAWDYGGLFQRDEDVDAALKRAGEELSMDRLNGQAARSMVFDELKDLLDRGELTKLATMVRERRCHPYAAIHARPLVLEAIARDDEDLLGVLLDLGLPPDPVGPTREVPLLAALATNPALADRLLAAGANPAAPDVLRRALEMGDADAVGWLLEHGADVTTRLDSGDLVIHEAVRTGARPLVERVLDRDLSQRDAQGAGGNTPLHVAAEAYDDAMIELLLERGARTALTNDAGQTPLHTAIASYARGPARLLHARGAEIGSLAAVLQDVGLDEAWLTAPEPSDDDVVDEHDDDDDDLDGGEDSDAADDASDLIDLDAEPPVDELDEHALGDATVIDRRNPADDTN